jgi:hypothetical protein
MVCRCAAACDLWSGACALLVAASRQQRRQPAQCASGDGRDRQGWDHLAKDLSRALQQQGLGGMSLITVDNDDM